jgi:hypothetical protein
MFKNTMQELVRENRYLRSLLEKKLAEVATPADTQPLDRFFLPDSPARAFMMTELGAQEPFLSYDHLRDTRYAHPEPAFNDVLHVFAQSWIGIRAAVGALPGHKLAISTDRRANPEDITTFLVELDQRAIKQVVFHGYCDAADQLISALAQAQMSQMVYLVYHGNIAQWENGVERQFALRAIEAAQKGKIARIHFLQNKFDVPEADVFLPMLFNPAPLVDLAQGGGGRLKDTAFLPGTESWRKNLHANAFGAAQNSRIRKVMHYAQDITLPNPLQRKLKRAAYAGRDETFSLMARVGITLNVSLVECHPMVGLESEACGTACLRGPLHLGYGEDHTYVRLVEVANPLSTSQISQAIDRVLDIPAQERTEIVQDYTAMMNKAALGRYREFLGK